MIGRAWAKFLSPFIETIGLMLLQEAHRAVGLFNNYILCVHLDHFPFFPKYILKFIRKMAIQIDSRHAFGVYPMPFYSEER